MEFTYGYRSSALLFVLTMAVVLECMAEIKIEHSGSYTVVNYGTEKIDKTEFSFFEPSYNMPIYSLELDRYWPRSPDNPFFRLFSGILPWATYPSCPKQPANPITPDEKIKEVSGILLPYKCTGQIVSTSKSGPVVLTAAHCVNKEKPMRFRSAKDQTKKFSAFCAAFLKDFETAPKGYQQVALDFAFVKLRPNHKVTSKLEIEYSITSPPETEVEIYGFPYNWGAFREFRGLKSKSNRTKHPSVIKAGQNTMNSGASGGAWLDAIKNKILTVTSAIDCCHCANTDPCENVDCKGQSNQIVYGPVLGSDAKKLFEFVENSCK